MSDKKFVKFPDKLWFLSNKEARPILEALERQWGFTEKLDYVFIRTAQDNVYIAHRDFANLDRTSLRINNVGIYFCEIQKNGDVRLSIEGSQIIGPKATKNILDLEDQQVDLWMKGYELENFDQERKGHFIIRHGEDFMGCGYIVPGKKILNYVPKARRIHATLAPIAREAA
ncbi:hypothetical protein HY641_00110 [Candidatus Woesearchaeota archaeon]|nr:hypothetical protein [Candidatus Woesearchaeota archaeon]